MRQPTRNTTSRAERSGRSASIPTPSHTPRHAHADQRPSVPRRQHLVFRRMAGRYLARIDAVERAGCDVGEFGLCDRRGRTEHRLRRQAGTAGPIAPTDRDRGRTAGDRHIAQTCRSHGEGSADPSSCHPCELQPSPDRRSQALGALFGRSVKGVRVVTVREYLTGRGIREEFP